MEREGRDEEVARGVGKRKMWKRRIAGSIFAGS